MCRYLGTAIALLVVMNIKTKRNIVIQAYQQQNNHQGCSLTEQDIRVLLDVIESKQVVSMIVEGASVQVNGVLLGIDLSNNELLLSDMHPRLGHNFLNTYAVHPVWVRVKTERGYLHIELSHMKEENGLLTCKMGRRFISHNQRWRNRVSYQPWRGPKVMGERDLGPNLEARLLNLSSQGMAIDFWGQQLHGTFSKGGHINVSIEFHAQFSMQVEGKVLNHQFIREPSSRTQLRVYFPSLSALDFSNLDMYIDLNQMGRAA